MDEYSEKDRKIFELEERVELVERKSDVLTNLLKEANAEFEQALEKVTISEANFRVIFEHAPEAIFISDLCSGRILDFNPRTLDLLGYAAEELHTMHFDEILQFGFAKLQNSMSRMTDREPIRVQEGRLLRKDGTIVDAELTCTAVAYRGSECLIALVRDVTERRQLEELSRYKELFENVTDPVFISDLKGRFLEVNDVACDSFGYPRDELLNMTIKELAKPGQMDVLSKMGDLLRCGKTVQFELETYARAGESSLFEFHTRPITYRGKRAILSVARDLSIRKKLEHALIETARLTAVGEMAAGVAHNFNNLLQMIMGAADAALAKIDAGKIRECREAIVGIHQASQRGAEIVRRIKDFTHVRGDQLTTSRSADTFDLAELVQESVELTKPLWKDLPDLRKYEIKILRTDGCFIRGRPSEICEVLLNLIKNALEAMEKGGNLTISTAAEDERVCLKVSDTGHGIPEENMQKIFQPFFTTKGLRSNGLGLSSSLGLLKKHQAEIQVESIVGHGTTFTLTFPRAVPPAAKESQSAVFPTNSKIKFLIIDDEAMVLKAMELFFEDTEVELVTASSGVKGLRKFLQEDFDIVLCDLGMDDMNGWEVGKEIKRYCHIKGVSKTPFLLYTGWDRKLDADMLESSGVDRVVTKPVRCDDLLQIIREVASSQSYEAMAL